MSEPDRISSQEVYQRLLKGENLLLVCAYEDERSFRLSRLKGAVSYSEFLARCATLPRDQEIVFY